jgi:hypothetical protein
VQGKPVVPVAMVISLLMAEPVTPASHSIHFGLILVPQEWYENPRRMKTTSHFSYCTIFSFSLFLGQDLSKWPMLVLNSWAQAVFLPQPPE